MLSSSNSKNSSSDDDLLGLDLQARKKHFLDYFSMEDGGNTDQNDSQGNVASHSKANATNNNISSNSINNNNGTASNNYYNNAQQSIDSNNKKMNERGPSTSKMATSIDQLKSTNQPNNVDAVYSILSMLGSINSADITSKFLEFSKNREMCAAMRLSGCISLLVQIIHSEPYDPVRQKECVQALHNIISCHNDDKVGRREARVLKLNEQLFLYCDALRSILKNELSDNIDRYPIQAIGVLMKISFDEDHRYAMCQLGALQTISTLIQLDHEVHGPISTDNNCITLRRYAGMCLTNLTFGDGNNKALLCSNKKFMKALVDQINSSSDELVQVTASVIRNLSWRADVNMKEVLNEIGTVKVLTLAAMKCTQENTLKAILSALWNLSNHCAKNKAEFCEICGAIEFLVDMLSYEAASKTTSVIENAGGILRNISTHIAIHEEFRVILRRKSCLVILLQQLKSPSLTVVSNACGTLGNLSAHSIEDQKFLRENGAIPMLRSLIYSKHKMISTGSTIALRHLLACKSNVTQNDNLDSVAKMMDLKELPTLNVRKQKALEHELSFSQEQYKLKDASPDKDDKSRDNDMKVQDIEDEDEEAPTNFSKFDDDAQEEGERGEYQETNLDQITDYSIRYAENQSDSEEEVAKPVNINSEDTIKSYNTEGTPHAVLSGAASMSDLRKEKLKESVKVADDKKLKGKFSAGASGIQTPEKTVNYCVEGTPGNFSRNDSLSDLEDNSKPGSSKIPNSSKIPPPPLMIRKDSSGEKESIAATPKSVTFLSLAEETPLMFSRTSSMGSLSSAEPGCVDDKSSVFSDFSRLASGIISPSELPDSPTQSIPQSPSRLNARAHPKHVSSSRTPPLPVTREVVGAEGADDSLNTFHIENTPAAFSYAASSLSNLSFDDEPKISTDAISKDFQLMKDPSCEEDDQSARKLYNEESSAQDDHISQPPDTAEQSDVESADDDILLESCINIGMNRVVKPESSNTGANDACDREHLPKFPSQLVKENPIDMMRSGAPLLPPYLPVVDELNRFIVEDSPCNFSLMSGLSAITIESSSVQQSKPTAKVEPIVRREEGSTSKHFEAPQRQEFNDSLSSLSIESEDDGNLLSQAIAAGVNKPVKSEASGSHPINIPFKPRPSTEMCNDSISSVDSCGKDEAANSILEMCIRSGINKVVKKDSSSKLRERNLVTSSPKKSMLPTFKPSTSKKVQDKKDEELLQECINTGIRKNTRQDQLVENIAQLSITDPKNAETTSVIAQGKRPQCVSTITGVEVKSVKNTIQIYDQDENTVSRSETFRQGNWTTPNGCSTSFDLNLSLGSVDDNILERSNEYPAAKLSLGAYADLEDDSMNVSNEFMMENEKLSAKIEDKHKDPDLMLKSVDRLTHELVSTAEYLRKNAAHTISDEISKMSGSNTWNDENSFPSISMSAPMIGSTNDDYYYSSHHSPSVGGSTNDEATIATDQIFSMPEEKALDEKKLDDKTPTNENYTFNVGQNDDQSDGPSPRVDFKVGGEIGPQSLTKMNFMSYGPTSIETCSTMSNSTIVQVEAKRIANKLTSMTNRLMDSTSSLDLENIRPPSSMDCISLNSFQESSVQQSPFKKKSLMTGLIAKRALGGHQMFSSSVESVNSIFNIESIRPPSIMDELLDSMISVDSIVSEVVDPATMGISNYETALSDMEDSLTLRSCQDLSKDEGTLTGTSSDFSSVESTPKKRSMRSVTPKQKRQSDKERYKTYTIQVDMLLKEQQQKQGNSSTESMRKSLNARQRRSEDRNRFETQIISHSPSKRNEDPERFKTFNIDLADVDEDLSIRAMTDNFEFIRNGQIPSKCCSVDTAGLKYKLNRIRSGAAANHQTTDDSLEYERQNSETESQRDQKNSLTYETNFSSELEETSSLTAIKIETETTEKPKPIRTGKNSYISPYRMTTRVTPMKNKSLKIAKSPTIAKVVTRNTQVDLKPSPKSMQKKPTISRSNSASKGTPSQTIAKLATTPMIEPPLTSMPIRQGTFIQDEPTLDNVPVVNDLPPSPVKTTVSKLKPPTKVSSASKIPTTPTERNPSPKKASNVPTSISQLKYRSNSNASMKIPIMTPVRSNTGINLLNNPKKNVSSKIAGIWKSGAEKPSSKESLLKKPVVSVSSTQLNCGNKLKLGVNARRIGKDIIKRSSTFDEIV